MTMSKHLIEGTLSRFVWRFCLPLFATHVLVVFVIALLR